MKFRPCSQGSGAAAVRHGPLRAAGGVALPPATRYSQRETARLAGDTAAPYAHSHRPPLHPTEHCPTMARSGGRAALCAVLLLAGACAAAADAQAQALEKLRWAVNPQGWKPIDTSKNPCADPMQTPPGIVCDYFSTVGEM
jgi:hypothetical protein